MIFTYARIRRRIVTVALLLSGFSVVHGQEYIPYNGPLTIGTYEGTVSLSYQFSPTDSLLNGPFVFKNADVNALLEEGDSYFAINGAFLNNVPQGYWRFHFGEYSKGDATFQNSAYQVNVTGTRHLAEGRIVEGKPDGTWTQTFQELENSDVINVPFKSSFNFMLGIPQFSFQIENESMTLVGRFLRDGFAHDQWELYGNEMLGAMERWHFSEGKLIRIDFHTESGKKSIEVFTGSFPNTVAINLDERYMHLLALKYDLSEQADSVFDSRVFTLLNENVGYYQKIGSILAQLGDSTFMPDFRVKVDHYLLDGAGVSQLDSITLLAGRTVEIRKELQDNTQLQLLELADADVAFLLAAAEEINRTMLQPIERLALYHMQDILEFVPYGDVLELLGLDGAAPSEIMVNYPAADTSARRMFPLHLQSDKQNQLPYGEALTKARATYAAMDSIRMVLAARLSRDQREKELALLEESLIQDLNSLNDLTDSLALTAPGRVTEAIQNIQQTMRENLRIYSALDADEGKVEGARKLAACFDKMYQLASLTARLPVEWEEMQQVYSDEVWNPFTATVMEEQVKKRITSAYHDVLTPYILGRINGELDCSNVNETIRLIEATQQRVFDMREEDTSRLERKLKKEQNPLILLELFGIDHSDSDS